MQLHPYLLFDNHERRAVDIPAAALANSLQSTIIKI